MTRIDLLANPMTTAEDIIVGGASGVPERLAIGSEDDVLTVVSGAPTWQAPTGGSGGMVGNQLIALPHGHFAGNEGAVSLGLDTARLMSITIPSTMLLRGLVIKVQATGTGTFEWGLFDYSSNAAACTKLAGGSGVLNSATWMTIAATGAPVTIDPGNYIIIMEAQTSSVATVGQATSDDATVVTKFQASYTWDDTPDITSGWTNDAQRWAVFLKGDITSGVQW